MFDTEKLFIAIAGMVIGGIIMGLAFGSVSARAEHRKPNTPAEAKPADHDVLPELSGQTEIRLSGDASYINHAGVSEHFTQVVRTLPTGERILVTMTGRGLSTLLLPPLPAAKVE